MAEKDKRRTQTLSNNAGRLKQAVAGWFRLISPEVVKLFAIVLENSEDKVVHKTMNDLTTQKRIIYIFLGLVLLGVLGFFLYKRFLTAPEPTTTPLTTTTGCRISPPATPTDIKKSPIEILKPGEEIEVEAEQKLIRITDFPVVSPTLNKEGNKLLFYKKDGGGLFMSGFNGRDQEKISNLTILGMIEAKWSPAKDRAAVFYLDQEILKGFLHIGTTSVAILPQDVKTLSWSPDGKSLTYALAQNSRLNLITTDSSGKNPKTTYSTPLLDAQISWISADKISFQTAPSGLALGHLFTLFKNSKSFNKTAGPFYGLTSLWSPNGTKVLLSVTDNAGKNLKTAVEDAVGKIGPGLGIKTLAEKCVWASASELYCAVPKIIFPETIWPDDYLQGKINTADSIIYLNPDKKEQREILEEQNFDITNLLVSKNNDYLFFVDRITGSLWALQLK